jgi:hypothetical protein
LTQKGDARHKKEYDTPNAGIATFRTGARHIARSRYDAAPPVTRNTPFASTVSRKAQYAPIMNRKALAAGSGRTTLMRSRK